MLLGVIACSQKAVKELGTLATIGYSSIIPVPEHAGQATSQSLSFLPIAMSSSLHSSAD